MHHLTQRELLCLDDFLKNEQLGFKTMNFFADQCTDSSIKQLCQEAAQMRRQNFQVMSKHLNQGTLQ